MGPADIATIEQLLRELTVTTVDRLARIETRLEDVSELRREIRDAQHEHAQEVMRLDGRMDGVVELIRTAEGGARVAQRVAAFCVAVLLVVLAAWLQQGS